MNDITTAPTINNTTDDVTTTIHDITITTDTNTASTAIAATVVSTTNATDVTMDTEVYGSSIVDLNIVLDQNGEYTLCVLHR